MDDKRVVDYFVTAGLLPSSEPRPVEDFSNDAVLKPTHKQDPIVDIAVINKSLGEVPPPRFRCIDFTPTGFPADLNHGSLRAHEMYICFRRGRDKPPLTDIGVLYEGKERVKAGCEVVYTTPMGRPANVNNSNSSRTYVTYRRAEPTAACDSLAVTDICIILVNKGEAPPHAFCQINKTLNKGMVGSDVYLCYKKSMAKANYLAYAPDILDRYPREDYPGLPLPDTVAMFCMPLGAIIESWPANAQHPLPIFSTFVLTGSTGQKMYGAAVTFYEEFPSNRLNKQQRELLDLNQEEEDKQRDAKTIHHNKCISLLSRWPFFDTFKKFLLFLYRISISGPHLVPIERYLSHFMNEVPFPSPQRPRILVQFDSEAISLCQPEEIPLPQSGASFITLLKNLGPENCMSLLLHTLMEQKILIHSLRPAVLTSVAEACANMIFPFHWQCPYIPLCPLGLSGVLCAPTPFIVGVDSRYFDLYDPPQEVICVDLDTNAITLAKHDDKKGLSLKMFPKKPLKTMRSALEKLFEELCQDESNPGTPVETGFDIAPIDQDFTRRKKKMVLETAIQEVFLRFMASILRGYSSFLLPITTAPTSSTTDLSSLFDMQNFIKSRDKNYAKFFTYMMKTQCFSRFIEERSFVSDKDASLAFFDECVERVDDMREDQRLIELEDSAKSERTVFVTPPEPTEQQYTYHGFPMLNLSLLPHKILSNPAIAGLKVASPCPSSPMTRRTKQEMRSALKTAQKQANTPILWAKCLLWHCYSVWFIHLPSHLKTVHSKAKALRSAYDILVRMQAARLQPPDEVCYRVLMQLCGLYHQPVLAVKVLMEMKRAGVQPNAITYGFYNKAVLECKWPTNSSAFVRWNRIRNTIKAIAQFRRALKSRRLSVYSNNSESDFDRMSRGSGDSYLEDGGTKAQVNGAANPAELASSVASASRGIVVAPKTEFVNDLINVESQEERVSTGGMSDRGYSSMTLEDSKRISIVIGSEESIDSLEKGRQAVKPSHVGDASVPIVKTCNIVKGTDGANRRVSIEENSLDSSVFKANSSVVRSLDFASVPSKKGREMSSGDGVLVNGHLDKLPLVDIGESSTDAEPLPERTSAEPNVLCERTQAGSDESADTTLASNPEVSATSEDSTLTVANSQQEGCPSPIFKQRHGSDVSDSAADEADCTPISVVTEGSEDNKIQVSPVHSIRTPVTENDPLGLFNIPAQSSPPKKVDLLMDSPTELPPNGLSSVNAQKDFLGADNLLVSFEPPFSETSTPQGKDSKPRSNTLPSGTEAPTPPSRKSKLAARSESFSIALRSGASRFLTKITEIKQNMTPVKSESGSSGSLNRSECDRGLIEDEEDGTYLKKAGSQDALSNRSADELSSDAGSALDDARGRLRTPSRYAHYGNLAVSKLQDSWKYLKQNETFQYWSHTLKESLKESFTETWGISEDSISDEYMSEEFGSRDELDARPSDVMQLEEKMRTASAVSHDPTSGNGPPNWENLAYADDVDRSSLDRASLRGHQLRASSITSGSQQSIPQALFNIAVEVEMCSMSRCNSCGSLVYDEEILAGWSADDSNLNTTCQFCNAKFVPFLQIYIKDFRHPNRPMLITPSQSMESMLSIHSGPSTRTPHDPPVTKSQTSLDKVLEDDNPQAVQDQSDSSNATPEESKLIDFSPTEESKDMPGESPEEEERVTKGLGEGRRCQSACLPPGKSMEEDAKGSPSAETSSLGDKADDGSSESSAANADEGKKAPVNILDPISVPYLSPLVLRKEIENILDQEGDLCLSKAEFLDEHPIIFWNMVWYFKRLEVPSHMSACILTSKAVNKDTLPPKSWLSADSRHVSIRAVWDNLRLHDEIMGQPLYMLWSASPQQLPNPSVPKVLDSALSPKGMMQQIVSCIMLNDVLQPLQMILNERRKLRLANENKILHFRSIYREILFLSFVALGRENIDHDALDREYKLVYQDLDRRDLYRLKPYDRPPKISVTWCRRLFNDLEL